MTEHKGPSRQVIQEWLTTAVLGELLGVEADTIKHRIRQGVYRDVRKVPGKGGLVWQVYVYDEAVPPEIGQLYELQIKGIQPQCFLSIRVGRMLMAALENTNILLRQVLKELSERPR